MDYEMREYNQEYPYRRRISTEQQNEKTPYYLSRVIVTQFIIFIALSLVIALTAHFSEVGFSRLKNIYGTVMQRDMAISEVWNEVKSVFGFLKDTPLNSSTETQEAADDYSQEQPSESTAQIDGAGGEDLIYPKENASFSPFYLSMPIVRPINPKRLTSSFGYRINPVTNEYGFHSGLDMAAPTGTPIKAAFDGTVSKAANSKARGNYVMIDSPGAIKTVYCHCSELLVTEGQQVSAGEIIAKVGSTGQATGPHLHFEIRINGIYYNPVWALDF